MGRVVGGAYGKPWSQMSGVAITPEVLHKLGQVIVDSIHEEARKAFSRRGWSEWDPEHKIRISESFSYEVVGNSTLKFHCSYPPIQRLLDGVDRRKMTWLTQEAKDKNPSRYALTPRERELGMNRGGRVSKGERLPLVLPLEDENGTVVFRTAPPTFSQAWVHPGIKKFTFLQRGIDKGKKRCAEVLAQEVFNALSKGDPSR